MQASTKKLKYHTFVVCCRSVVSGALFDHSVVMNLNTMNIHFQRILIIANTDSEGLAAPHHELFPTDSKLIKAKEHEY